ncbi:MAG TPA: spore germination protein, partial [Candidatus Caccomorpha excrementavium]|nr:spore germination protein [Candidatus Caccomorpha excrementavium]
MPDYISANLDESVAYFNQALVVEDNFDIIYRVVNFVGRKACIYFIDGFVKDEIMQKLMQNFGSMTPEQTPNNS